MASMVESWRLEREPTLERLRAVAVLLAAWSPVAVGVVLYMLRGVLLFSNPQMFAEDGQVFLADARNEGGWEAISGVYAGYLLLIPRLIAAVLAREPLTLAPMSYLVASVLFYLVTISLVLSTRVSWLLPRQGVRSVAFLFLCLLPVFEIYGNIANIVAVAGMGLLLAALLADPVTRRGRVGEAVSVVTLSLTGPFSIFLWPLFVGRYLRNRRSRHSRLLAGIVAACGAAQAGMIVMSDRGAENGASLGVCARFIVDRLAGNWVFGTSAASLGTDPLLPRLLAAAWLAACVLVTARALGRTALWLWVTVVVLAAVSAHAYGVVLVESSQGLGRALAVPTTIVMIMLMAATTRGTGTLVARGALICLALGVLGYTSAFFVRPYLVHSDMAELQRCEQRGSAQCTIPIYSPGWRIVLTGGSRQHGGST